jgi:hypothetical protein
MSGCAPNRIYRDVYEVCNSATDTECNHHSLQLHQDKANGLDYILGFVEIDDQGQLRDRKQMSTLTDKLYEIASNDSVLVTVFVHGWHHNAEPGDGNIEGFKQTLTELARYEKNKKSGHKRKIVGVYVGWRGESINIPLIRHLTFWDRKNTAQDVGYLGVTELLLKLEEIANVRNSVEPPIKSRLVVIGHSFGGAVVYSATSQILMSRFVNSQQDKGFTDSARGFGDLVVLLNPAFEALRYAPAFDLSQSRCSFFEDQAPKLAILTSETDRATDWLFPLGRTFATLFETHSTVEREDCGYKTTLDEGEADRNTVGHYQPLVSHRLAPVMEQKAEQVASAGKLKNIWANQTNGGSTRFGNALLTHLEKTVPRSPYLNIRVDEALMDGHSDIFGKDIREFLELLIQMSTID